jgi:hypothetical protein
MKTKKKRGYSWLLPTNVVPVAKALLQADSSDFQPRYQKEAWTSLLVLEKTLCQYVLPNGCERVDSTYSVVEELDRHLEHLIDRTNHVLGLLMPEKRISLAAWIPSLQRNVSAVG